MNHKRIIPADQRRLLHFASDLHFGHGKLAVMRGFEHAEAMDEWIVKTWNEAVPTNGLTVVLGDVSFAGKSATLELLARLHGRKILVVGNHDAHLHRDVLDHFEAVHDRITLKVRLDDGGTQRIVCDHFPLLVWDQAHYGAWHLHGHSHGSARYPNLEARVMDVGIEAAMEFGSSVLSFARVAERMATRAGAYADHHVPRQ